MNKDEIREVFQRISDLTEEIDRCDVAIKECRKIQTLIAATLIALDDDGWVKCSERLPKLKERVQFELDSGERFNGYLVGSEWKFPLLNTLVANSLVVRWRELPPPPEKDDG